MKSISIAAAAAAVLFLAAPAAFAQTTQSNTNSAPNGVTGAAPTRDVGTNPSVANNPTSATTSSSMEMQHQKEDNAAGVSTKTNSNTK
jgi:hypothetical protein